MTSHVKFDAFVVGEDFQAEGESAAARRPLETSQFASARLSPLARFFANHPVFASAWGAKYWVAGIAAVLGVGVYLATFFLPPQYVGSVTINIGEVRTAAATDASQRWVELPAMAAGRFNNRPFKAEVLRTAGLSIDDDTDAKIAMESLVAAARPPAIVVTVRATSPERVSQILDAAVMTLRKTHQEIAGPRIQILRQQMNEFAAELGQVETLQRQVIGSVQSTPNTPTESLGYALAITRLSSLFVADQNLKNARRALDERLELSLLTETHAIMPPSVLPRPVGPRRFLYAVVTALGTLVLLFAATMLLTPIKPN